MIPHYSIELSHRATDTFRFQLRMGSETGTVIDITGWSNIAFTAKRRYTDVDADAVYEKVLFAGVEVIDAATGIVEVTIEPSDGDALEQGLRHNLVGDITGINSEGTPYKLNSLAITAYPRVRRSNF